VIHGVKVGPWKTLKLYKTEQGQKKQIRNKPASENYTLLMADPVSTKDLNIN